jgi:pimeloyl-ACP methyl ester carboxylesterase
MGTDRDRKTMPTETAFKTPRLRDVPERPRVPHPYLTLAEHSVLVGSPHFGRHRVVYRRLGEGPPLLLVHGLMTSGYSFRYVIAELAKRFTVYVPDLVGMGDSDKPDASYDARSLALWIADFQRALGIRGCDVIGNSLGGYLAMWLALEDPAAIGRLVNLHSPGAKLVRLTVLHEAMKLPFAERVLRTMVRAHPRLWILRNVHYYDETLKSLEELDVYGRALASKEGLHAFARILGETLAPADLAAFERTLTARRDRGEPFPVPLLLMYARRDPMVPPAVGEHLRALVPGAPFVWLERASHFAHVDAVPRFLPEALRFLTEDDPARA